MKRTASIFITGLLISNVTWAAKFENVAELTSKRLEALAQLAKRIQKNEDVFGDCSRLGRYSFTRKAEEKDVNTLEQLNVAKGGVFHDDDPKPTPVGSRSASQIVAELFDNVNPDADEDVVVAARKDLTAAVKKVLQSTYLTVWEASHANEDGSWKILDVLDPRNEEVLFIRLGYCGT